ncbi:MAG: hypothetical protein QGG05_19450 [Candidatus Latescibacteria bacterium]|nr:hypothetical protein [Candidatus Latescibacterota bacterium]
MIVWSYEGFISPLYAYSGFRYRPAGLAHLAVSILICALPALWLPTRPRTPAHVLLWIMQIFIMCSSGALNPVVPYRGVWETVGWSCWMVACMAVVSLCLVLRPLKAPPIGLYERRVRRLFFGGVLATLLLFVARFGLPSPDFSLSTVGDRRLAFRETIAGASRPMGYLLGWTQSALAPIAIMSAISRRRPWGAVLGASLFLWLYLMNGTRTSLVAVPFAVALWWAMKRRVSGAGYAGGAAALLLGSVVVFQITNQAIAIGSIAKRLFAVPGVLGMFYFDYFSDHPPGLYRDGIFGAVTSSPYSTDLPRVIGEIYLSDASSNANVNFFADSYAQLWVAGLLVAFAMAIVLWLLDSVTADLDLPAVMGSLALLSLAIVNTGALVWMTTNGMTLALVIYWFAGPALFPPVSRPRSSWRRNATMRRSAWPTRAVP